MAKFYTAKKTIGSVEYTAQFNGIAAALEAVDNSYVEGTSNTSVAKLSAYILENVIVEPKGLKPDDFDSMEEFQEVIAFGRAVMQGEFRPAEDEKPAKRTSKE